MEGLWSKQNPFTLLVELQIGALWKTVWRFLKKLGIKVLYGPAIPLLGTHPEKTIPQKDTYTPLFSVSLFTIIRTWKPPRCSPRGEWIKKTGKSTIRGS